MNKKIPIIIFFVLILIVGGVFLFRDKGSIDRTHKVKYVSKNIREAENPNAIDISKEELDTITARDIFNSEMTEVRRCGGFCREFDLIITNPFNQKINLNDIIETSVLNTDETEVNFKYYIDGEFREDPYQYNLNPDESLTITIRWIFEAKTGEQSADYQIRAKIQDKTIDSGYIWANATKLSCYNIPFTTSSDNGLGYTQPFYVSMNNLTDKANFTFITQNVSTNQNYSLYALSATDNFTEVSIYNKGCNQGGSEIPYGFVDNTTSTKLPDFSAITNTTSSISGNYNILSNDFISQLEIETASGGGHNLYNVNGSNNYLYMPSDNGIQMQAGGSYLIGFNANAYCNVSINQDVYKELTCPNIGNGNVTYKLYDGWNGVRIEFIHNVTAGALQGIILNASSITNSSINGTEYSVDGDDTWDFSSDGDNVTINSGIFSFWNDAEDWVGIITYNNDTSGTYGIYDSSGGDYPFYVGKALALNDKGYPNHKLTMDLKFIDKGVGETYSTIETNEWERYINPLTTTIGEQQSTETTITLLQPDDAILYTSNFSSILFETSYTITNYNITNATLYIWYNNGSLFNTNTTINDPLYNQTNSTLGNFIIGQYIWNYLISADNSTGTLMEFAPSNRTFEIGINITDVNYTGVVYETSSESFKVSVISATGYTPTNAILKYDNVEYTADIISTGGSNYDLTKTFDIPTGIGTKYFNFSFDINGVSQTTDTYSQIVSPLVFGLCNSTLIEPAYINFTFNDETNNTKTNGTITSSTFSYYLGNGTYIKSSSFTNLSIIDQYRFCSDPLNKTLYINVTNLKYSGDIYPERTYNNYFTLTNSTREQLLYLLSSSEGIYTTFQVINTADQTLSDVLINMSKTISSIPTLIEQKLTDSSGGATFWVNPNSEYNLKFIKGGYDDYSLTLTPTQTSYTITMGETTEEQEDNYQVGINYIISPLEKTLNNDTDYVFSFYPQSNYYSLQSYGFELKNSSGSSLGSTSGSSATGSNLTITLNTGNHTDIEMIYFWVTNNINSNGTIVWNIYTIYQGELSLMTFFQDLKNFAYSGFDDRSRALIAFFLILFVTAIICYVSELKEPLLIAGIIAGQVILYNFVGLIASPINAIPYFPSIISILLFFMYLIYEFQR